MSNVGGISKQPFPKRRKVIGDIFNDFEIMLWKAQNGVSVAAVLARFPARAEVSVLSEPEQRAYHQLRRMFEKMEQGFESLNRPEFAEIHLPRGTFFDQVLAEGFKQRYLNCRDRILGIARYDYEPTERSREEPADMVWRQVSEMIAAWRGGASAQDMTARFPVVTDARKLTPLEVVAYSQLRRMMQDGARDAELLKADYPDLEDSLEGEFLTNYRLVRRAILRVGTGEKKLGLKPGPRAESSPAFEQLSEMLNQLRAGQEPRRIAGSHAPLPGSDATAWYAQLHRMIEWFGDASTETLSTFFPDLSGSLSGKARREYCTLRKAILETSEQRHLLKRAVSPLRPKVKPRQVSKLESLLDTRPGEATRTKQDHLLVRIPSPVVPRPISAPAQTVEERYNKAKWATGDTRLDEQNNLLDALRAFSVVVADSEQHLLEKSPVYSPLQIAQVNSEWLLLPSFDARLGSSEVSQVIAAADDQVVHKAGPNNWILLRVGKCVQTEDGRWKVTALGQFGARDMVPGGTGAGAQPNLQQARRAVTETLARVLDVRRHQHAVVGKAEPKEVSQPHESPPQSNRRGVHPEPRLVRDESAQTPNPAGTARTRPLIGRQLPLIGLATVAPLFAGDRWTTDDWRHMEYVTWWNSPTMRHMMGPLFKDVPRVSVSERGAVVVAKQNQMGSFWLTELLDDHKGWYLYPIVTGQPQGIEVCFHVPEDFDRVNEAEHEFVRPARFERTADDRWELADKGLIVNRQGRVA